MEKFFLWTFRRRDIRSSFDSKSWCKMIFFSAWNTIFFWVRKSYILNVSEIENTVFFCSKKLMESWYFLDIFYLFMIFQDLGKMVFCAVKIELEIFNFIKREALAQVSSCEFCEICKNTYFAEHGRATASDYTSIKSSERRFGKRIKLW